MEPHSEPDTTIVSSSAQFYMGEILRLRPDMGGGVWEVIEILPPADGHFARAVVKRR